MSIATLSGPHNIIRGTHIGDVIELEKYEIFMEEYADQDAYSDWYEGSREVELDSTWR